MQAIEFQVETPLFKKCNSLKCSCEQIVIRNTSQLKLKKDNHFVCEICSEKRFLRQHSQPICLDCDSTSFE